MGRREGRDTMPSYFTREEAGALLPRLEPVLRELQELRAPSTAFVQVRVAHRHLLARAVSHENAKANSSACPCLHVAQLVAHNDRAGKIEIEIGGSLQDHSGRGFAPWIFATISSNAMLRM